MEYWQIVLYITFGILPSLAWLAYYLGKDLHPEPKKMITKIFFFGILVTVPVFFIQVGLMYLLNTLQSAGFLSEFPIFIDIIKWFFVIALSEELLKYSIVKFVVLKSYELDEPLDIMLYMVIVALGFAALENVLYLLPTHPVAVSAIIQTTLMISFMRFIGATFLHTLCSALLGYFIALSYFNTKNRLSLTITGIGSAMLLHGLYDFSIMRLSEPLNILIPIIVIITLAIFVIKGFDNIKKVKSICT